MFEKSFPSDIENLDLQISRRYEIISKIGKGAYGIVWKAIDKYSGSNGPIALKKVFNAFKSSIDAQHIYREVSYLLALRCHPFIINLKNVYRSENDNDLYLVFELMENDLYSIIKSNLLHDIHQRYIFWQLLTTIKYIHSAGLMHRDLKPSNLLINSDSSIKLCDFGLSRTFTIQNDINTCFVIDENPNFVATRWYRPPEILLGSSYHTPAIDMWSAGCILAELVTGQPLFPGTSSIDQIERVLAYMGRPTQDDLNSFQKSEYDKNNVQRILSKISYIYPPFDFQNEMKNVPDDAIDLIKKLTCFNPSSRLTAEKALEHPYVKQFHSPKKEVVASRPIHISLDDSKKFTVRDYKNQLYREAVTSPDIPISKLKMQKETQQDE